VPNLAAAIDLCTRLLHFGGLGHTCSIHSQNESAIREYGKAVPAFRICVNTSAVHGSIGYSTNLFPAMTLGCGAPGGNITSDNIGPQHLMNIKRIAWSSRPIEHRTIPADRRMQADSSATVATAAPVMTHAKAAEPRAPEPAAPPPSSSAALVTPVAALPDRATIARTVEHVMQHLGIARGASAAPAAAPEKAAQPPQTAAAIVDQFLKARAATAAAPTAQPMASPSPAPSLASSTPAVPPVKVSPFVSETDVRNAVTRGEKIFIGPKTILTPSARDMGVEHAVFVETEIVPSVPGSAGRHDS
jgi:hypothetical protein